MTKPQIRELYLAKRHNVDPERIATQLGDVFSNLQIKIFHSFIANQERNEVDTKRIRQTLQMEFPSIQWTAPRMIPGTKQMEHYVWNDETVFITNRWGIEEPDPETSKAIDIQTIDAILVPLLAFDNQGQRVGYGGGYYDRFLAQCRPDALKIGLSRFEPIKAIEDANAWDVKLDICVTPTMLYRWDE